MPKKFAIFDIDGTIFRSSLLIEMTEAMVQAGLFPTSAKKEYAKAYKKWADRLGSYENYLFAVVDSFNKHIKGVKRDDFLRVVKKVSGFHKNRVYRHTRALVKKLKKQKYFLLAISGSPFDIVHEFCAGWGFDKVYGRILELDKNKKYTGRILLEYLIDNKEKILKRAIKKENLTLTGSVGVGDSEADIAFLKIVENPICFNPNKKLFTHAKRAGWSVVVERKDVVYKI
jgi:HAD superfamily hydrolase (TIGR01490 family)